MPKYVFRRYKPEYRDFFVLEKNKITKALGSRVKIEHIGSTAVAGLGGKGILDIMIGVVRLKMETAKKRLEKAGYEFREKASYPERLFFRIDYFYKNKKRRVHLHLVKFNSQEWKKIIGFRDYLLGHPEAVQQYIQVKKEAVKKALGDGKKYRKYKEKFIKNILKKEI